MEGGGFAGPARGGGAAKPKPRPLDPGARTTHNDGIEIINYSDGRVVFSVKQPARDIPGSYTMWEKQMDSVGNTIRNSKTTVGPNGELIHIKNY